MFRPRPRGARRLRSPGPFLPADCPVRASRMTPELFELIATRFKAFGEPARLRILHELRAGERTVGDLVAATGLGQANLSRHLQYLLGVGFVSRRKAGLHVWYALADRDVLKLCDVMCGRLDRELAARRSALRR
jgi:DNA-binding transcriptional ArsR family regulator